MADVPATYVGRESIRAYFATYDGVILAGGMTLSETALRTLGEDCILAQGMVCFAFTLAGQAQTRSTLRATLVLRRDAGRWRILQHHFSSGTGGAAAGPGLIFRGVAFMTAGHADIEALKRLSAGVPPAAPICRARYRRR